MEMFGSFAIPSDFGGGEKDRRFLLLIRVWLWLQMTRRVWNICYLLSESARWTFFDLVCACEIRWLGLHVRCYIYGEVQPWNIRLILCDLLCDCRICDLWYVLDDLGQAHRRASGENHEPLTALLFLTWGIVWRKKGKSSKEKKKSRKTSVSASPKKSSSGSSGGDGEGKAKSFCDLADWHTRDVACVVCSAKDSSPCTIFPGKKRLWGYTPKYSKKVKKYTTTGKACFLCSRVQMSCYYPMVKLGEMKQKLGSDPELHKDIVWFE